MDYHKCKIETSSVLMVLVLIAQGTSNKCPLGCICGKISYIPSVVCQLSPLRYNEGSVNFSILLPQNLTYLGIVCNNYSIPIMLQPRTFEGFYRLESLDIGDCYLGHVDENVFAGLNTLTHLRIINAFKLFINHTIFINVPNLKTLVISNSGWHGVSPNSLNRLSKIHIDSMPGDLCSNLSRLKELNIHNNNLIQLPDDFLSGCSQLETLNFNNNPITKLPPSIRELKNLKVFLADNTLLTDITLLEQTSLTHLSIYNSSLTTIPPKLCGTYSDLICLRLGENRISKVPPNIFEMCTKLEFLDLSRNSISTLFGDSFKGLSRLNELILNHNEIKRILTETFSVTPSLEELDLSNNKLRRFDTKTFNGNSLKTIILSGNPWVCNCEDMDFLKLLSNYGSEINFKLLFCDHDKIPVLQYARNNCWQDTILVYGLSTSLVFIFLVVLISTIMYKYRTEIQILLFVRFGWRILSKKNRLDEEDKMYDAFVSFHSSQDDFVVYEMLPRLEGTNPAYKLCVHFRDFLAGEAIVDNITESIENSKRTILLLNDQFLTSEWCRYEFQAAHFEALSNKLNSLILVLLEDVNPDLVDGGLKLYMKTRTYLRYDDPRFWDKLRFALPEKKENNVNEDHIRTPLI